MEKLSLGEKISPSKYSKIKSREKWEPDLSFMLQVSGSWEEGFKQLTLGFEFYCSRLTSFLSRRLTHTNRIYFTNFYAPLYEKFTVFTAQICVWNPVNIKPNGAWLQYSFIQLIIISLLLFISRGGWNFPLKSQKQKSAAAVCSF